MTKELPKMMFYALLIIIVSMIIVYFFCSQVNKEIDTASLEGHIAVNRMLASENCLAYSDGERIFSGVVDLDRLDDSLTNCYEFLEREGQGILLKFESLDGSISEEVEVNPSVMVGGITCDTKDSKYSCYSTRKYVLYEDGGDFEQGILDFRVVTRVG